MSNRHIGNYVQMRNQELERKIINMEVEKLMLQEENKSLKKRVVFVDCICNKSNVVAVLLCLAWLYWYCVMD